MLEIEQKYVIEDVPELERRLIDVGAASQGPPEEHRDAYYNHPGRDFAETHEALRVRRIGGVPMVTYKGPKLPGEIKARRELEWRLDPGDPDGHQMEQLLTLLGFRHVATVVKTRRPYTLANPAADFTLTIDHAESLGWFAEIELVIEAPPERQDEPERQADPVAEARRRIGQLAERLELRQPEARSYLTMLLEQRAAGKNI